MQDYVSLCASMTGAELHRETVQASRRHSTGQWELAALLVAIDRTKRWMGCSSTYEYADRHLGLDGGRVHQLLRVGRALLGLPHLSAAVCDGRVSWCKAREITRVATADDEANWVEFAARHTTRDVEGRVSRRPHSRAATTTTQRSATASVPSAPIARRPSPATPPAAIDSDSPAVASHGDVPSLFELELLEGTGGNPEALPFPPPLDRPSSAQTSVSENLQFSHGSLIRLVAALDAESYAIFQAARDMLTRRLGKRLSLEQVLTEMASTVLASGDARARARYAVVVHVGADGEASYQTDRGNLPVGPRQAEEQTPFIPVQRKVDRQSENVFLAIPAPNEPSDTLHPPIKQKKRGGKKRRKLSAAVMREVLARAGHRCERCGRRGYLEFDHKRPLSAGGTDDAANLRVLCRACHALRHRQEWVLGAEPAIEVQEPVGVP